MTRRCMRIKTVRAIRRESHYCLCHRPCNDPNPKGFVFVDAVSVNRRSIEKVRSNLTFDEFKFEYRRYTFASALFKEISSERKNIKTLIIRETFH